ncbi:unnamed protein product [Notodromas monacha]|uniref:Transcription initiation factor TFIID subunit 10 n=1 Tax=Notodromas monacha TaxID=399045 RepID=A0A7R9BHQ7_9CRUS|nr:unnamed protein product [Notodromas monacha]CAG0914313.1 unnamed protein product [Notodromas monacha]
MAQGGPSSSGSTNNGWADVSSGSVNMPGLVVSNAEKMETLQGKHAASKDADRKDTTDHDGEDALDPEAIYGQVFTDFLQSLEEFTPTIPDAVTSHYMSTAGFQVDDPRLLRLISLSSQKFIADVTNDAMQHCKLRTAQQLKNQKQTKDRRFQLTLEDLLPTLKERGINVKKPHYFI